MPTTYPATQMSTQFRSMQSAYDSADGTAPVSRNLQQGETYGVFKAINENAARTDLTTRYGGSRINAVCEGLEVLYQPGGTIIVTEGTALIDGIVQLDPAAIGVPVFPGVNYVYLTQLGKIQTILNLAVAPPGVASCYLGKVTLTGDTGVTSYKGVMYDRGAIRYRELTDEDLALDNPPAGAAVFTRTESGLWFSDGSNFFYQPVGNVAPKSTAITGNYNINPTNNHEEFYYVEAGDDGDEVMINALTGTGAAGKTVTIVNGFYGMDTSFANVTTITCQQNSSSNEAQIVTLRGGGDAATLRWFRYPDGSVRVQVVSVWRSSGLYNNLMLSSGDQLNIVGGALVGATIAP